MLTKYIQIQTSQSLFKLVLEDFLIFLETKDMDMSNKISKTQPQYTNTHQK